MRGVLYSILFSLAMLHTGAQAGYIWARNGGGATVDYGWDVCTDFQGNHYVIGFFQGAATFDGVPVVSAGGDDIFVAKYDPAGNILWVQAAGGPNDDRGLAITTGPEGQLYLTGFFGGNANFGPFFLPGFAGTARNVFVAKLQTNGIWNWANEAGGPLADVGTDIEANGLNEICVTGFFNGQFNCGAFVYNSAGGSDVFLARYDFATGAVLNCTAYGGNMDESGHGICTAGGNCFIAGVFNANAVLGPFVLAGAGMDDGFAMRVDNAGVPIWATGFGGLLNDGARGIDLLPGGDPVVTGRYSDTAVFGAFTLTSLGDLDIFVTRLNGAGGVPAWAISAGGVDNDEGANIDVDPSGAVYATGHFEDACTFGATVRTSTGLSDVYLAQVNPAGSFNWVTSSGGVDADRGLGVVGDGPLCAVVTGGFENAASFGPFINLVSNGGADMFVYRYCLQLIPFPWPIQIIALPAIEAVQVYWEPDGVYEDISYRVYRSADPYDNFELLLETQETSVIIPVDPGAAYQRYFRVTAVIPEDLE